MQENWNDQNEQKAPGMVGWNVELDLGTLIASTSEKLWLECQNCWNDDCQNAEFGGCGAGATSESQKKSFVGTGLGIM